jgi:rhodanese-related sulfurtransferase
MASGRKLFSATAERIPSREEPGMSHEITLNELSPKIRDRAAIVVEALPAASFAAGHLPGAVNLPLDRLESDAKERLPDPDAEIVVYCSGPTCNNSHVAHRKLTAMGYRHVRVFSGGKAAWKDAGLALEYA